MEKAYRATGLSDEPKMQLAFGLGKSFDDLKDYEQAFDYFSTANGLKCGMFDYSIAHIETYFGHLKERFSEDFFRQHQSARVSDLTPIFVLGMPRSGTTLVEQILASHPKVHAAGELDYMSRTVTSHFGTIDDAKFTRHVTLANTSDFSAAGDTYMAMMDSLASGSNIITDKMPDNFRFIGMIKLMLPNAKIIHCCRSPEDTCLSAFKNHFSHDGHYYSYDLKLLGHYFNLYQDLMAHWHNVLPDFIYDIHYEQVVANQKSQTQELLNFCGLDWDDACLDFHLTDRPVRTASAAQVRRPIYNGSVQSWRQYESQLAPLLEILR